MEFIFPFCFTLFCILVILKTKTIKSNSHFPCLKYNNGMQYLFSKENADTFDFAIKQLDNTHLKVTLKNQLN